MCETKLGAHPTSCYPFYAYDRPHTALYHKTARKNVEVFAADYLAVFVHGAATQGAYLKAIGGKRRALAWRTGETGPTPGSVSILVRTHHERNLHPRRNDDRSTCVDDEDGALVFHGFGSPLVQLAMHVAKRTHAPAWFSLPAQPTASTQTLLFSRRPPMIGQWIAGRSVRSAYEELFDLAAAGRMGRMFLSGLQIDKWGNCNVTALGYPRMTMKLPGGGGGGNLSCDASAVTLWTAAHRATMDERGRKRSAW